MRAVESHRPLAGTRPTKLLIYAPGPTVSALKAELQPQLTERCDLVITADEYLEFLPKGADKGHAVAELAGRLGLEASQVAAAGDGWNDVGMLRWAGTGIAMATGRKDLHDHAEHIVPGPEQDGLAEWIERNLLVLSSEC
jgi:hydroxymethylpyrimidine pyrophosphatase-like HAD family hydrolase